MFVCLGWTCLMQAVCSACPNRWQKSSWQSRRSGPVRDQQRTDIRGGDGRSPDLATDDVRSRGEAQWPKSSQARPRPRICFGDHLGRGGSGCGNCRGWGQGEHWEVSQHRQAGTQQQLDLSQRLKVNLKCHDKAYLLKSVHFVKSCPPKLFSALNKLAVSGQSHVTCSAH